MGLNEDAIAAAQAALAAQAAMPKVASVAYVSPEELEMRKVELEAHEALVGFFVGIGRSLDESNREELRTVAHSYIRYNDGCLYLKDRTTYLTWVDGEHNFRAEYEVEYGGGGDRRNRPQLAKIQIAITPPPGWVSPIKPGEPDKKGQVQYWQDPNRYRQEARSLIQIGHALLQERRNRGLE